MFSDESGRLTNTPTVETIRAAIREYKNLGEDDIRNSQHVDKVVLDGQQHHWEKDVH